MLIMFFCNQTLGFARVWKNVAPGIAYQDLLRNPLSPWAHIHSFRIDLTRNQLALVTAQDLEKEKASVDALAHEKPSLIAINGGFFDQKYHPLGLRIREYQTYNPLKPISWWGIFLMKDEIPSIISSRDYTNNKAIRFAIQSGPRLIINGRIPSLKTGIAERTALGITRKHQLVIVVTENVMVTTTELAQLMRAHPLHCIDALNLDGGSSSQLFAQFPSLQIRFNGLSHVSDAIVVTAKK